MCLNIIKNKFFNLKIIKTLKKILKNFKNLFYYIISFNLKIF